MAAVFGEEKKEVIRIQKANNDIPYNQRCMNTKNLFVYSKTGMRTSIITKH